jgi:Ca-activated chloride channel family protein
MSKEAVQKKQLYDQALSALRSGNREGYQAGRVGVELSVAMDELRSQSHVNSSGVRHAAGRTFYLANGVWMDEGAGKLPQVRVKTMSNAYFRVLERHPEAKEVFQLGPRVEWVTPSGTMLIIDPSLDEDSLTDPEIDRLFEVKK